MILLLAQLTTHGAAAATQLPDNYKGMTSLVIGTIVTLFLGGGVILFAMQKTRTAITKEVRLELQDAAKEIAVKIQSPLVVKGDVAFVTVDVHDKAINELRAAQTLAAAEIKAAQAKDTAEIKAELLRHGARRSEIYKQNEEHGRQIASLQSDTRALNQQLHQVANQVENLPQKIKTLLFK